MPEGGVAADDVAGLAILFRLGFSVKFLREVANPLLQDRHGVDDFWNRDPSAALLQQSLSTVGQGLSQQDASPVRRLTRCLLLRNPPRPCRSRGSWRRRTRY